MLKKRIFMLVLISMIILPFLIAAATEATTQIETDNFVIEFQKPPFNKFSFSDPADPEKAYDVSKGVVFSFVNMNEDKLGYPSHAMFAITYRFESKGTFKLFANSDLNKTGPYRLYDSDVDNGLNYKIEIFSDKTNADAGTNVESTIDVPPIKAETGLPEPVVSEIYSKSIITPMTANESKVFKLSLIAKNLGGNSYEPYVEGQYKGYLIMEFTPSV